MSTSESKSEKNLIVNSVIEDDEVLSYWFSFAFDITTEQDALELLKDIVQLWLTIRGFSISKSWLEDYKREAQGTTKKKSLRKELKKATH